MGDRTGISWTDSTWNPVRGCSRVSAGCQHCYAEAVAARFSSRGQPYEGLARMRKNDEPQWTGKVRFIPEHLEDPLRWRRPRKIFVNSMSDLFHERLEEVVIDQIFAVMALAGHHTYQVLTKRPARMLEWFERTTSGASREMLVYDAWQQIPARSIGEIRVWPGWPLPHVWLGVSCENQATADERIPLLLETPAAVRWISAEPLLGPINLTRIGWWRDEPLTALEEVVGHVNRPALDWVVCGGESGKGRRVMDIHWLHEIVSQCQAARIPVRVKQDGGPRPGVRRRIPDYLWLHEFPQTPRTIGQAQTAVP